MRWKQSSLVGWSLLQASSQSASGMRKHFVFTHTLCDFINYIFRRSLRFSVSCGALLTNSLLLAALWTLSVIHSTWKTIAHNRHTFDDMFAQLCVFSNVYHNWSRARLWVCLTRWAVKLIIICTRTFAQYVMELHSSSMYSTAAAQGYPTHTPNSNDSRQLFRVRSAVICRICAWRKRNQQK